MNVTRRDFLKFLGVSAAAIGLSTLELGQLEEALANPNAPSVLWLQGAACTGCSVSFLNRISTTAPTTAADALINSINLIYHPNLMSLAGQSAAAECEKVYKTGNYILVVEGGVPTAFNGSTCWAWTFNGVDVTFLDAVKTLAPKAKAVISVGTCASFGGAASAPPNPTMIKSVSAATGVRTINVAGCPPHPDWIAWAIVQLLLGNSISLDSKGRPSAIYSRRVHDQCPRREHDEAGSFANATNRCLRELGCKGPETIGPCPKAFFNGGKNWCIGANAPCLGCTEPTFAANGAFYRGGGGGGDD